MGRPPNEESLMLTHKYLAKYWDVLSDALLCGMVVPSIARKRHMSADRVRIIIRDAWAMDIRPTDVRKYMERG